MHNHKFLEMPAPMPPDMMSPRIMVLSRFLAKDCYSTLSDCGLFAGQDYIIILIKQYQGISPSGIAKMMGVSLATVSVSIKRLEKAGFIERRNDENDARTVHLYTTIKADAVDEKIKLRLSNQENIMSSKMTESEKSEFLRLLDMAIESTKDVGGTAK